MSWMWKSKCAAKNKYGAVKCKHEGITFASKLEMGYYKQLQYMQKAGEISFFLFQVPFRLDGNTKYVVDFIVFHTSGEIEFIDTKGRDTPMSILKRKQVESRYPIEIKLVKKV